MAATASRVGVTRLLAIVMFVVAGVAWWTLRSEPASAQSPPRPAAADTARFAADVDYPPFSYRDPDTGEAIGFDVDVFRTVADKAGLHADIRIGNWFALVDDVKHGRADVVPMLVTEKRKRSLLFSEPYLHFYHQAFGPRGGKYIASIADLEGKRVAVQRAGLAWEELRNRPGITLVVVENEPNALLEIAANRADYALVPNYIGYEAARRYQLRDVIVLSPAFLDTEYAFAINPRRPDLVPRINAGLRAATTNGDIGRLYVQWIANLTPTEETFRSGLLRAAWVVVPLFAFAVLLLVWWRRARHRASITLLQKRHIELHDPVTHLSNHTGFRRKLAALIERGTPFALVRVDLVELGAVEAIAGHAFVDELLRILAGRLQTLHLHVAKVHDRGFMVASEGIVDANAAQRVMDEILAAINSRAEVAGLPIEQVACAGAALYPEHGDEPDALMRAAGVATEDACNRPGSAVVYRATLAPDPRKLTLLTDLRAAIRSGTLGHLLQPKLDLGKGHICGAEMLVRWHHPVHGEVAPVDFVPFAERTGVIGEMTVYLIDRAIAHLRDWRARGLDLSLSVNVSVNDLSDAIVVDRIMREASDVAGKLMLEVTETAVMRDPDKAFAAVDRLRAGGLRISLDDFGTGNASLTYLRRLAPEEVKIDRSFIMGLLQSEADQSIVRSTIELAHSVRAVVTAEGVEDAKALHWLRVVGCDHAQGYWIAPPMTPEEFLLSVHAEANAPGALRAE